MLRFEPNEIVVRSRTQRGDGWQVRLDGQLEVVSREQTAMRPGTEVLLERGLSTDDLERFLTSSILRDAPWLLCRHRAGRPLEVRVNGRLVREEPALPPPSMSFRRRGLRGVVGLGPEPRAEIFAHGFRVRDAATLDELLVEAAPEPSALAGAAEGLSPRIIIDSRNLEVLMARGDAREDSALRRLVAVGHRELSRLVRAELDRHAGQSIPVRLVERLWEAWSASRVPKIITALVLSGALVGLALQKVPSWLPGPRSEPIITEAAAPITPLPAEPYRDLWGRYRGPDIDSVGQIVPTVDLSYRPPDDSHFFAALWINGLLADGNPDTEDQTVIGPYEGATYAGNCLEVELNIDSPAGLLRLPVATGHVLDPESVRLDHRQMQVVAFASGQPAVVLDTPLVGRLRYRSGPGTSGGSATRGSWPALPSDVAQFAREHEGLTASTRALEVAEFVRQRVVYDTSAETAARHLQAKQQSIGLFARAVAIGAGDCDVQNSLVVAMLNDSGVPARLAVGWIGADGRARTGLHAWAEYLDAEGRWSAVDASTSRVAERSAVRTIPPVGDESNRPPNRMPVWIPAIVAATLALAVLTVFVGRRRWRRRFQPGDAGDIVGLVRGAAVRPRSFEEIHALFARRLLRQVSGRRISLARVREMAGKGRLACGRSHSELARQAARGGGVVLDLEQPESAAVADVLAAVKLDRWQELLDRAAGDEVTAQVENRLAAAGESCRILVADNPGCGMTILDGTALGLGRRWVVLDRGGRLWQSVRRLADRRPARAALLLADAVVEQTRVPPSVRHRCLSAIALDAIIEMAGDCRE